MKINLKIMLTLKSKMRVNLAVKDYIEMFPDDYKAVLDYIAWQRDNLDNDMAEIKKTHAIKRALGTMPEKLFQMIQQKLNKTEMAEFGSLESQRWFYKENKQFALTKI